jgi:hypothetical protein
VTGTPAALYQAAGIPISRLGEVSVFMAQLAFALSGSEPAMKTNSRAASIAINVLMFALWIFFLSCAGAALAHLLT